MYTLSMFVGGRTLGGVADTPEGCAAIQPDLREAGELGEGEPREVQ